MSTSFIKLSLLAAASITAAAGINASDGINVDISLGATPIESLAENVHMPVKALVDLLNTNDYASVNVDDWCSLLQQPVETVNAWPGHVKEHVFAEVSLEISVLVAPQAERRDAAPEIEGNRIVAREETIRRIERQALEVHNARLRSGNSGCLKNVACGSCVAAAGLAGVAGLAGCVGAALAAIEGTAGTAAAIVYTAFIECNAKVASVMSAAIGVCHSAL